MQIEEYKTEYLNLNEFIEFYKIDMILNNELIKTGAFELQDLERHIKEEQEDLLQEIKEDIQDGTNYTSYYIDDDDRQELEELLKADELDDLEDLPEYINQALYDKAYENIAYQEIYQYFIISENDLYLFEKYTNYPVYYNEELDIYLIGITHYGMSWSFIFTEAPRPEFMKIKKYDEILSARKV